MARDDVVIDAATLHAAIDAATIRAERPVLLDVRWELGDPHGQRHFEDGHIPGAIFVDLEADLSAPPTATGGRHPLPDVADLQESARRWGLWAGRLVVAYDNSGGRAAARAWWLLRWAGVDPVRLLDGGLGAWTAAGYPLETGDSRPTKPVTSRAPSAPRRPTR